MLHLPLCYSVLFFCQRPGIIEKRKAVTYLAQSGYDAWQDFLEQALQAGQAGLLQWGAQFLVSTADRQVPALYCCTCQNGIHLVNHLRMLPLPLLRCCLDSLHLCCHCG